MILLRKCSILKKSKVPTFSFSGFLLSFMFFSGIINYILVINKYIESAVVRIETPVVSVCKGSLPKP